jgi:hypothetical protein
MVTNLDNEIWVSVKGYEDVYAVSNMGRVKVLKRNLLGKDGIVRYKSEYLKKIKVEKNGYAVVVFQVRKRQKVHALHRLVAIAFLPNPQNKPQVNHKNGVPLDNHLENLEWVTAKENVLHSFRVLKRKVSGAAAASIPWLKGRKGKDHPCYGLKRVSRFGKEHSRSKAVRCDTLGLEFESGCIAARELGVSQASISTLCNNKGVHAFGLTFRYL